MDKNLDDQPPAPMLEAVLTQLTRCFPDDVLCTPEGLRVAEPKQLQTLQATYLAMLAGLSAKDTKKLVKPLVQLCEVLTAGLYHASQAHAREKEAHAAASREGAGFKAKAIDLGDKLASLESQLNAAATASEQQKEVIRGLSLGKTPIPPRIPKVDHPCHNPTRTWREYSDTYDELVDELDSEVCRLREAAAKSQSGWEERDKAQTSRFTAAQEEIHSLAKQVDDLKLEKETAPGRGRPSDLLPAKPILSPPGGPLKHPMGPDSSLVTTRVGHRSEAVGHGLQAAGLGARTSGLSDDSVGQGLWGMHAPTQRERKGVYFSDDDMEKAGLRPFWREETRGPRRSDPYSDERGALGYEPLGDRLGRPAGGRPDSAPPPPREPQVDWGTMGNSWSSPRPSHGLPWEGQTSDRPGWLDDWTDRVAFAGDPSQRFREYEGHPVENARDPHFRGPSQHSHPGAKDVVSDQALGKLVRAIPKFDPYGPGSKDFDTYLADVVYHLQRFSGVTMEDIIFVIRATSSRDVSSFLRRQPQSALSTLSGLYAAFKREFACLTADAGLPSAMSIKQGRTEAPSAYYNRLRNAYFGSQNYPLMEEDVNFRTLFIANLFPILKQQIACFADPKTMPSATLRDLASKAWAACKTLSVARRPTDDQPSVFQIEAEDPFQLELEGDYPAVEVLAASQSRQEPGRQTVPPRANQLSGQDQSQRQNRPQGQNQTQAQNQPQGQNQPQAQNQPQGQNYNQGQNRRWNRKPPFGRGGGNRQQDRGGPGSDKRPPQGANGVSKPSTDGQQVSDIEAMLRKLLKLRDNEKPDA